MNKAEHGCGFQQAASFFLPFLLFSFIWPGIFSVQAEYLPNQVAVIANSTSQQSMEVAKHYANRRQIPLENLIPLVLPLDETISRQDYEKLVVGKVREILTNRKLEDTIRVLVTTFDTPLRVSAPEADGSEKQDNLSALTQRQYARDVLSRIATQSSKIQNSESPLLETQKQDPELVELVNHQLQSAGNRIQQLPPGKERDTATSELGKLIETAGGIAALNATLKPVDEESAKRMEPMLANIRQQLQASTELLQILDSMPNATNRKNAYKITARAFGAIGLLKRASQEIQNFSYQNSDSSLDSELTLLWWDRDLYPIQDRLPSPIYYRANSNSQTLPILLVSRLDGPTFEIAKGLVDSAIETEQHGLAGKIFVDARGLTAKQQDLFFHYDQDLRDFGWLAREETDYSVEIDNYPELIEEAKNAAIYVGWYSVHKFEGDFKISPGAIGYHIASSEALSVRKTDETGWCKNLLERGITATLGPVDEPFLESFPLPSEFLSLMLTGKYQLSEAYFLTSKFISWRMVLFGDPLYNPWKSKPAIQSSEVKLQGLEKGNLPEAPSEKYFTSPSKMRSQLAENRAALQKKVDLFFEANSKSQTAPK